MTTKCTRCNGTGEYWTANVFGDKTCYKCGGSGKQTSERKVKTVDINGKTQVGDFVRFRSDLGWTNGEIVEQYTREDATPQALKMIDRKGTASIRLVRRLVDEKRFWI